MKITNRPYFRTLEEHLYFEALVRQLRKDNPKRPPTTVQAPSTQRTLDRDPLLDFEYQNRPLPTNWKANPNAKTIDESVAKRDLDPHEISHFESVRRRPKNSQGESQKSATTPERHTRAVESFIYSPPAQVTKREVEERAVNLVQYKTEPMKEVWKPMPWWKALIHRIKGNKIRIESK